MATPTIYYSTLQKMQDDEDAALAVFLELLLKTWNDHKTMAITEP